MHDRGDRAAHVAEQLPDLVGPRGKITDVIDKIINNKILAIYLS